jgi:hypothetical protein
MKSSVIGVVIVFGRKVRKLSRDGKRKEQIFAVRTKKNVFFLCFSLANSYLCRLKVKKVCYESGEQAEESVF